MTYQRRECLAHVASGHPCKYNHGNAASTAPARRTYGGTSADRNTAGSATRDQAFGTRTPTGPKPVSTSRRGCQPLHHRHAALVIPALGKLRHILVKLGVQRLGDESLRAFAQHRVEQILPLWLAQWNCRILLHGGVTPFVDAEIDLDNRIPAGHAVFFNSLPYTKFVYSSRQYLVDLRPTRTGEDDRS